MSAEIIHNRYDAYCHCTHQDCKYPKHCKKCPPKDDLYIFDNLNTHHCYGCGITIDKYKWSPPKYCNECVIQIIRFYAPSQIPNGRISSTWLVCNFCKQVCNKTCEVYKYTCYYCSKIDYYYNIHKCTQSFNVQLDTTTTDDPYCSVIHYDGKRCNQPLYNKFCLAHTCPNCTNSKSQFHCCCMNCNH